MTTKNQYYINLVKVKSYQHFRFKMGKTLKTIVYKPRIPNRSDYSIINNFYAQPSPPKSNTRSRYSYGLLCISSDGYVVMNESPSYFTQHNKYLTVNDGAYGTFSLNSNLRYNLQLAGFPNATVESQFAPPRGKKESIDQNSVINTKVREFVEETKLFHPKLNNITANHAHDPFFRSFFTDSNFTLEEEWVGLDNNKYWVQYSVFVIDSIRELQRCGCLTRNYILNRIHSFSLTSDTLKQEYADKYKFNAMLDYRKRTVALPIKDAVFHMNNHKMRSIKSIREEDLMNCIKKYHTNNQF